VNMQSMNMREETKMKINVSKPKVIVQGVRYEEGGWGPFQFATPYRCGKKVVVSVHIGEDSIKNYGDGKLWFESEDRGETWHEVSPDIISDCGLKLQNGDTVIFPRVSAIPLNQYEIPDFTCLTPGTDYAQKAKEGTLPQQDGVTSHGGTVIRAYNADRLPPSLDKKQWYMIRKTKDGVTKEEYCDLKWPYLTRVVFSGADLKNPYMKGLFPTGVPKIGPDGAVWITAFSGEGHLNPENGQYSPYYSAEIFRSTDGCRSFCQYAHMEYPADGKKYPYLSGGFSDNEIAFFEDGSICWFFRSAWYGSTGREWAPMYMSRSTDMGKSWTAPEIFSFTGVYPSLCKLDCGVTLLCFARPGMYITACKNDDSTSWIEPIELMTSKDRSSLANIKHEKVRFHDWDGACNNAVLLALDDYSALIFNTDFYYPDQNGVKRKTVICRKITVEM